MSTNFEIERLEGDELLNFVVEYAFKRESEINDLSLPVQTAYFISNFETEFYNGGVHQFLTNSSGRFADETIQSFTRVGAKQIASLLEASTNLDAELVLEDDKAAASFQEIDDKLHQLYPSNEDGNVGEQLSLYLQENRSNILES
ncbi:DMP19 family protein [Hymenobacter cellulosivorans]|uniref:DMP19 family protein n=1 Tax=Hymenobacter cellulosivorans TaxID=2932249 RepID=A0ABY4F5X5_9BACT|nr:DUF4375 domain-containing protein [Hymenobacter cellulosivorans]UOQ51740.1 DMP19 family protein [Hymenobacter cellulosivorans]